MSFRTDYAKGLLKEKEVLKTLRTQKRYADLIHCDYAFSKFDFYNDKYEIELKSRNCRSDRYTTTFIPVDKVERSTQKKIILFFKFEDGLFYIRYKPKRFSKFNKTTFKRPDRTDHKDIKKDIFEIPIEKLKRFSP